MFLQYAAPGAVWPLYSTRVDQLGFGPLETAACCASSAIATVAAPLIVGHVADRWIAAEHCQTILALLAGVDLWVLADLHSFPAVLTATLVFWLLAGPILVLGAAICFTHLPHADRQYGPVRLWGTVGWMAANWVLAGGLALGESGEDLSIAFRLGAVLAWMLAAYSLCLPHTPPQRHIRGAAPLEALRLLRGGRFAVFGLAYVGVCITLSFATQLTPLLLERLGMRVDVVTPTLTLAQVTEVLTLALLPMLLLRLGLRGTMIMALGAWVSGQWLLAVGRPLGLVVGSLVFNGLCISGFLVAAQIFLNRTAGTGLRASAQALLSFGNGLGQLLGHLLAGQIRRWNGDSLPGVFLVGAVLTTGLLLLFLAAFHDPAAESKEPTAASEHG
jgi:MFS family permease